MPVWDNFSQEGSQEELKLVLFKHIQSKETQFVLPTDGLGIHRISYELKIGFEDFRSSTLV